MVRDSGVLLKHGATVSFHTGTFESPAKVRLLNANELEPGETGWVQIKTERPAPVVKGDLFILRDSRGTLAGGEIVEPRARRHRRFQESLLEHLEVLQKGTPEEVVLEALASREPCPAKSLTVATGLSWEEVQPTLASLVASGDAMPLGGQDIQPATLLYTTSGFGALTDRLQAILADFHRRYPLRRGIAKEEIRSKVELAPQTFALVLQNLAGAGVLGEEGPLVRLASHAAALDEKAQREAERYVAALAANPYGPPGDIQVDPEVYAFLVEQGRIVRVSPDVTFTSDAYRDMVQKVTARIREKSSITVAEVRDLLGTSRKYVLALMEYLDQQRITRRVGDERVLR